MLKVAKNKRNILQMQKEKKKEKCNNGKAIKERNMIKHGNTQLI